AVERGFALRLSAEHRLDRRPVRQPRADRLLHQLDRQDHHLHYGVSPCRFCRAGGRWGDRPSSAWWRPGRGAPGAPPAGGLSGAGQNVSRASYSALFAVLTRSAAVTISIAAPAIVTWTGHGLGAGDPVVLRTTGALPTGLTAGTVYYVIAAGLTANSFEVST